MDRTKLLLFRCLINREIEEEKLALVQYIQCVLLSDKVDEVLGLFCLQCTAAGSAEKGKEVEGWEKKKECCGSEEWLGAIPF